MKKINIILVKLFALINILFLSACPSDKQKTSIQDKSIQTIVQIAESYGEKRHFSGNILIGQGDSIIFKKSYGYSDLTSKTLNRNDTKFRLASISKQFTAVAILVLEQNGKLNLDEPIDRYTSRLEPNLAGKITLNQILSHSSGLGRDIESLTEKRLGQSFISLDEIINLINQSDLIFQPGKKWSYSNLGYTVAAAIIEDVTNLPFGEAMQQLIFEPLQMLNTGHETSEKIINNMANGYVNLPEGLINARYEDKSYVIGAGSIYSTMDDLFIWSRAVMSDNFLSKQNRKKLLKRQAGRYSYGWFVDTYVWPPVNKKTQATNIHHDGGCPGFSSKISILTKHDIVVIMLSNKLPTPLNELSNKLTNISVGFEDESLAKEDGTMDFFKVLLNQPADSVIALEALWKAQGNRLYIPNKQDIFLTGRAYIDSENFEAAIKVMDYLIEVYPKWDYPYLFKGFTMEKLEQTSEAVKLYQKVLEINPSQSNALSRLNRLKKDR